jgi:hypothetical protein
MAGTTLDKTNIELYQQPKSQQTIPNKRQKVKWRIFKKKSALSSFFDY